MNSLTATFYNHDNAVTYVKVEYSKSHVEVHWYGAQGTLALTTIEHQPNAVSLYHLFYNFARKVCEKLRRLGYRLAFMDCDNVMRDGITSLLWSSICASQLRTSS